ATTPTNSDRDRSSDVCSANLVNPAAAGTLTVAGFPSSTTAGTTGDFTVTAKDAYGNIATGYTGQVAFTSTDASAVLPSNYTFARSEERRVGYAANLQTGQLRC